MGKPTTRVEGILRIAVQEDPSWVLAAALYFEQWDSERSVLEASAHRATVQSLGALIDGMSFVLYGMNGPDPTVVIAISDFYKNSNHLWEVSLKYECLSTKEDIANANFCTDRNYAQSMALFIGACANYASLLDKVEWLLPIPSPEDSPEESIKRMLKNLGIDVELVHVVKLDGDITEKGLSLLLSDLRLANSASPSEEETVPEETVRLEDMPPLRDYTEGSV